MPRSLENQVVGCAKAGEPEIGSIAKVGQFEGPVAHGAGAQEGRGFRV